MAQPPFSLPTLEALATGLNEVFGGNGQAGRPRVIRRAPIVREARGTYFLHEAMTFPAEIVTCSLPNHHEIKLFCKYQEDGRNHDAYGHRGGVIYEAEVYRALLQSVPVRTPPFYGAFESADRRRAWLVLGFLEHGKLLTDFQLDVEEKPQPTAMGLAARWIGRFHALTAERLSQRPLAFLKRYDSNYYLGWVDRTCEFAGKLHRDYPWLEGLCGRADELLKPLCVAPPAVIHGEYYQNNVMLCDRTVYPLDWESAAIGAGEIDLASLTEGQGWDPSSLTEGQGWDPKVVQQALTEYKRGRWPKGVPLEFPSTFAAAKLYLHFRWLGERREWTTSENRRWRFTQLAMAARRLGLA